MPDTTKTGEIADNTTEQNISSPLHPAKKDHTGFLLVLFLISAVGAAAIIFFKNQSYGPSPAALPKQAVQQLFLSISSPNQQTEVVNNQVLVSGSTLPNTTVLIYSNSDQTSTDSDAAGKFSGTVILDATNPLLRITAYSSGGDEVTKTLLIGNNNVQANAENSDVLGKSTGDDNSGNHGQGNGNNGSSNSQKNKNDSANNITPVVAPNHPVSDPAEVKDNNVKKFLDIKKPEGKEKKLTVNEIEDIEKSENEGSKSAGLKIEKTEVTESTSSAQMNRQAVMGVVLSNSGGVIVLAHQIHRDWQYTIFYNADTEVSSKGNTITSAADIAPGMRIAVVGEPVTNGLLAKRIHVIPGLAKGIFERFPVASASATPVASPSSTISVTSQPTLSPTSSPSLTPTPSI